MGTSDAGGHHTGDRSDHVRVEVVPLARLERAACGLGIRRSIHLSYRGDELNYIRIFFLIRQDDFIII